MYRGARVYTEGAGCIEGPGCIESAGCIQRGQGV